MTYDFSRITERRGTGCLKWDDTERIFGVGDILPLWVADMDFQAPREIREALEKKAAHGIYGYAASCPGYYRAQGEWLKKRFGWEIEENWLTISPGVMPALNTIIRAFTSPGDKVLLQTPAYPPFFKAIENNGCRVLTNPLKVEGGRYRMDFADLKAKLDSGVKLFILCSPHNPVGRVWEEEELRQLGEICFRRRVPVVSDEIHGDLVLSGRQLPFPRLGEEFARSCLFLTSTGKTFNLAGLQISSTIICDPEMRRRFRRTQLAGGFSRPNIFALAGAEAAYSHGEPWLEALLDYLRENVRFCLQYFHEHIPALKIIPPEGTYLLWVDCRQLELEDKELREFFLQEAKVGFNPGHTFGAGGRGFVRINTASPREVLEEALMRVRRALKG